MSTAAAPRSISAIAFIVAGTAILLAIVAFVTAIIPDNSWLFIVCYAAMIAAHIFLARDHLDNGSAKTSALFAALGWLILLVAVLFTSLPGIVSSSAYFVIFGASVVTGAVILATRQLDTRTRPAVAALLFVSSLYMASAFFGLLGPLAALLTIVLGILAVVAGYLLHTRR